MTARAQNEIAKALKAEKAHVLLLSVSIESEPVLLAPAHRE